MARLGLAWLLLSFLWGQEAEVVSRPRVGLVLSGGGARGAAHVGVLQALEEAGIPIDYITGTSMGAMVGAFYAAGYTPAQMLLLLLRENRRWLAPGAFYREYAYYALPRPHDITAWEIPLEFLSRGDAPLPEQLFSDFEINLGLTEKLASVNLATGGNFDSLLVPYRAIGADLFRKRAVVFREGSLPLAVRVSISVPVFFSPITTRSYTNLVDGGVYDNFPVEPMKREFHPDFIIGVHVGSPPMSLEEFRQKGYYWRLFSHLSDPLSWQKLPAEKSFFIQPDLGEMSSTDFSSSALSFAVRRGYEAASACLEELREALGPHRADSLQLALRRKTLQAYWGRPIPVSRVEFFPASRSQAFFYRRVLGVRPGDTLTMEGLRRAFFRLRKAASFYSLFPEFVPDTTCRGSAILTVYPRSRGENFIRAGLSVFSPSGYTVQVGARAEKTWWVGWQGEVFLTQGSFAQGVEFRTRVRPPLSLDVRLFGEAQFNRYVYQRLGAYWLPLPRQAGVFSGLDQVGGGIQLGLKRFEVQVGLARQRINDTWGEEPFQRETAVSGESAYLRLLVDTENDRQYPTEGGRLYAGLYLNRMREVPLFSGAPYDEALHYWPQAVLRYRQSLQVLQGLSLGLRVEGGLSLQKPYADSVASILASPAFYPFPESPTLFLPELYNRAFVAGGGHLTIALMRKLSLRLEALLYQPAIRLAAPTPSQPSGEWLAPWQGASWLPLYRYAMAGIFYRTFLGPLGAFISYYDRQPQPLRIFLHLGFTRFLERPWQ
ncbi:MAG: hypothetical protein KatS3mg026_0221 [Bacteroidia bacterium]|nr:MAG: hypothetical protein KatS3mg026_0221 [Bacteroidia bacterium]